MKKLVGMIMAVLVCWNIFLTIEINSLRSGGVGNKETTVVTNNVVNSFSTDLTKITPEIEKSVVSIRTEASYSSGIIVKVKEDEAFIATNYHSIENAAYVEVIFNNLDKIKAEVAGYNLEMDVAILKIKPEYEVTAIKLGDSSLLKQGEFVLAIGSPVSSEYHGSLSFGIVSSPNRIVETRVDKMKYFINTIQSDITLNRGNSGSALVNMAGELVGLNTMTLEVQDAEGMSFSLPVNELKLIMDEIIENGSVSKLNLGLRLTAVSSMPNYLKSNLGIALDQIAGLYVNEVKSDFFGYYLGVRSGDIIIEINGNPISSIDDYIKEEYCAEDHISVVIIRAGEIATYEREIVIND